MTDGRHAVPGWRPPRRTGGAWAVVAALLAVGIVVPLLVFLYDTETPTVAGFPFYYWFQFLLIPLVSGLTFAAFKLSLRATEKDRPSYGLPAEPGDDDPTRNAPGGAR